LSSGSAMPVPRDFERQLWLDPLKFQGLIGAVLASKEVEYTELFRADGFAKPEADLRSDPRIAELLDRVG
jgi:hypothetical protein